MIRLGERLYEERIRRGLTLEDVERAIKIRSSFLSAIEKGEYNKLPSSTYAHGFVRNYIQFLGLPKEEELLALFRREYGGEEDVRVLPEGLPKSEDFPLYKIKFGQTVKVVLFIFLAFLGYIGFQYRYAIFPPPLEILSPKEGEQLVSQAVTVSGKTDPNATVLVNSDSTTVDHKGYFTKTITLFSGKTTITIRATSRFGKEKIVERHIEVKP